MVVYSPSESKEKNIGSASDGFFYLLMSVSYGIMKAAFIVEDKSRLTLFNDLAKDRQTVKTLTRKNHMLENVARRALDSMEEEGLVIREGDRYQLTVGGKGLVNKVRELERKGASREGVGESTGKRRIISPRYRT